MATTTTATVWPLQWPMWHSRPRLVVLHKWIILSRVRAEGSPAVREVLGALEANPYGLRSGRTVLAGDVSAKFGDKKDYLAKRGRGGGQRAPPSRRPYCLPFGRVEYGLAVDLRTGPSEAANVQGAPGDDKIDGKAGFESFDLLKKALLYAAPAFEDAEEDLDHPAQAIEADYVARALGRVNRKTRQEEPLHRRVVRGRVLLEG